MGEAKDAQWSSSNDGQKVREVLTCSGGLGAGLTPTLYFGLRNVWSASDWLPRVLRMAARCPTS